MRFSILQEVNIFDDYSAKKFIGDLQLSKGRVSLSSKTANSKEGGAKAILQISDRWKVQNTFKYGGRVTAITVSSGPESLT